MVPRPHSREKKVHPTRWSKYYEFSFGDVKAGELILTAMDKEQKGGPQWQKIYGSLENAIYGGRIDNDFDLRVLKAYIARMFTDEVMRGDKPLSGIVSVPKSGNVRDFQGIINMVPEYDAPSLFGLPSNIDRSV